MLGVSFDSPEDNAAFARKLQLKYPLLSDLDHSAALAYGAVNNIGDKWPNRISILIDENGLVERIYERVDPRDHPANVLAEILDA